METQFAVLNRVVKGSLIEKEHFKQRLKGGKGINNRGNVFQARETSTQTELREKSCVSQETKKAVSMARNDVQRKRERDEVKEVMGARSYKALQVTLRTFFPSM